MTKKKSIIGYSRTTSPYWAKFSWGFTWHRWRPPRKDTPTRCR